MSTVLTVSELAEWLETDGLGGFASGTVGGVRTRRYHAILLTAKRPPAGRVVLVNGLEVWVDTASGSFPLSAQRYTPDTLYPNGAQHLVDFMGEPWPTWTYVVNGGTRIRFELFLVKGSSTAVLTWRLIGGGQSRLRVRPLLSGRDYHATHHENPAFRFDATTDGPTVRWQPYPDVPAVSALSNGVYRPEPHWYRNFLYTDEQARGLDCTEDLAAPGEFAWDLTESQAVLIFQAGDTRDAQTRSPEDVTAIADGYRASERKRRAGFGSALLRAADDYIVKRGHGETIIAGYPWFTDWGRDTFIAMRGLCLATGRFDTAGHILAEWSRAVSKGMLPNFFPDDLQEPEYNTVDAPLFFIIAAHEYLEAARFGRTYASPASIAQLKGAIESILDGYAAGTRHGIRMDEDGLLAAGEPGVQLTWMDAKIGDWVVTPRTGKAVEVQALWINALAIGARIDERWSELGKKALQSFRDRFWNATTNCLFDVVDADHVPGQNDDTIRPNQIFAVGGLPYPLLSGNEAQQVVDAVERELLTPIGLRSVSPNHPSYRPRYEGGALERDSSYHQGTVWPWLMGAFVDAWLRVNGNSCENRSVARQRFLDPLVAHLGTAGLRHVSEIADANAPHRPRGCPYQAWSVGELIRIEAMLADPMTISLNMQSTRRSEALAFM